MSEAFNPYAPREAGKRAPVTGRKTPVRRILAIAAEINGIDAYRLITRSRRQKIARIRHALCSVAYDEGHSSTQIGGILGGRDHSTILHGRNQAAILAHYDPAFGVMLADLRARVSAERPQPMAEAA